MSSPWSAPISSSASPSVASTFGRRSSSRADDLEPIARRRRAPSPARTMWPPGDVPSRHAGRTAGWRERGRRRAAVGSFREAGDRPRRNVIRSATAWATAFSRARSRASGETSVARIATASDSATLPQLDREGDRDRAASRADIHDPQRDASERARRLGAGAITAFTASSTRRSVSGRGISARRSTRKASP